ncbi:hypothetical protein PHLCEN_2v11739 [Hermanssonia centrifuga]|uniref:Uncharacterized protein n=1 Tax=Hermanssonia centrifuga TaxID=98765 RepID=A0A2R6NJ51_9APHY|nr:hypothetical protein PHLCEN_2v11739 [Hermanssonia centrifuga]
MSSSPDSQSGPPCYVLVSHCPLAVDSSAPAPSYTLFSHPTIEYHYADDLPHALLPQSPDEHVVVLDYDPALGASPTAHCLSTSLAVVAVKVAEAPGAGLIEEDGPKNSKMYVVQTTTKPDEM